VDVLVTGGGGYLGTTLVPELVRRGHRVTVLDRFFFGEAVFAGLARSGAVRTIREDVRWVGGATVSGHDAVIDLAALSNDPAGDLDPWKTYEINYLGRARIARLAREAGVRRYLLASSCSVYGYRDVLLDETMAPEPLTAYARANVLAEQDTLPLATDRFCPTAVRFATLYGLSERMRFDLAVNGMVAGAWRNGRIPVMKDGTQWRPFLHVKDAARALGDSLELPTARIRGRVFNVGSPEQNFQIAQLAERVAASMRSPPGLEWYGDPDRRSYRVDFRRGREELGFVPTLTPEDATREIETALASGAVVPSVRHQTVDWYRHLLSDPAAGAEVALRGVVL
jgi:nucleoside-diphosphate-sugar epimerase